MEGVDWIGRRCTRGILKCAVHSTLERFWPLDWQLLTTQINYIQTSSCRYRWILYHMMWLDYTIANFHKCYSEWNVAHASSIFNHLRFVDKRQPSHLLKHLWCFLYVILDNYTRKTLRALLRRFSTAGIFSVLHGLCVADLDSNTKLSHLPHKLTLTATNAQWEWPQVLAEATLYVLEINNVQSRHFGRPNLIFKRTISRTMIW
jgi:hypothetical protein